jgi:hypothetical protein
MTRWRFPILLALGAVVVRVGAFLADRHLHYDDGQYGLSVLGMRHGQKPFEDLFSPQGPLNLPLLYAGDLFGFRTSVSPRVVPVLAGVVAAVAVWAAGRRLATAYGAAVAGALIATTGTMLWTTGPITGDGIAVALASCAVWGALEYRDRATVGAAVVTGLAMGAALSVKALLVTAAIPVGWWLWSHRRVRDFSIAVAGALAVGLAATLPFGFTDVWDQSVTYHSESEYLYGPGEQFSKLVSTLVDRDLPLLVALALGMFVALRAGARFDREDVVVVVWLVAGVLFLVFEPAMFRNHIASVIPPLVLLVAMHPPPPRVLAAGIVVTSVWWATHLSDVLVPRDYRGVEAELVAELRDLPGDVKVISDEPGFVWRAGLTTVPYLNDTSIKRIDQGQITTATVADAASEPDVCGVVVWSNRFASELPGLPAALRAAGLSVVREWPRDRSLWLKPACT